MEDVSTDVLGPDSLRVARVRLRVVEGPDAGRQHESQGVEVTIGFAPGNELRLTDPTVSRHHCVLRMTPEGPELTDLGSTNGTLIAGCRVKQIGLVPGVRITVGGSVLELEAMDQELLEPLSEAGRFGSMIGTTDEMRRLFALAARVATSSVTVLLEGETGTGKGLLAEAIHEASERRDGPFVVIDCGAVAPSLIESELFGHERGAFTGANTRHVGLFEAAQGGTVFLDEIGELPLDLQPRLLRVLENHEVRRVGSHSALSVDVRVIAATNRDLRREVNRGGFRSDLWYRLATVRLRVPPLREHRADIPALVKAFYQQLDSSPRPEVPDRIVATLPRGDWPGNVRELRAAVERALLMSNAEWGQDDPPEAGADHEASPFDPALSFRAAKLRAMERWEREYLRELLAREQGNISRSAAAARMDRSHLRALLRRYNLQAR